MPSRLTVAILVSLCVPAVAQDDELDEAAKALVALVPATGVVEGVTLESEPTVHPREKLADYINGDAESYYPHGVGSTVAAVYSDGFGGRVELDVFDMTTPLGAFGVYSQRRPDGIEPLELGAQGYLQRRMLVFFADRYYVLVRSISRAPEGLEAARKVADVVAGAIPKPHEIPPQFACFPVEDLAPNSQAYFPEAYLGLADMPPFFVVTYALTDAEEEGATYRLAYAPPVDDPTEAEARFERVVETLRARAVEGTADESPLALGAEQLPAFSAELKYRGSVLVVRREGLLLLEAGLAREEARPRLAELLEALTTPEQ